VQREDSEYEFTLVLELSQKHQAIVGKDRTGLFKNRPELMLNAEVGKEIAQWCNTVKVDEGEPDAFQEKIDSCMTVKILNDLFIANPDKHEPYKKNYFERKRLIEETIKSIYENGGLPKKAA
jgi:hypothetical protein